MPMAKFYYNFRFFDDQDHNISGDIISKILPLEKSFSAELWENWIDENVHDYNLIKNKRKNYINIINYCGWGVEEAEIRTRDLLKEELMINPKSEIIFFWSKHYSVKTEWGIFLDYWCNFCYPFDDSDILVFVENPYAIIYIDDIIKVVDRKEHFIFSKNR